jgi:hypothetical protein
MRIPTFALAIGLLVHIVTVVAQQKGSQRTPLGTQVPRPTLPQRGQQPPPPALAEAATAAIQRAMKAHGGENFKNIADSVAEGTLTLYSMRGPYAQYSVTVWRKGQGRVQRSIRSSSGEQRQGTNGTRTWDTVAGFVTAARGPALEFLETQTVRALPNLFEHQTRGSWLRDDGLRGADRVLTIEEINGRTTTYVINAATSVVTRVELVSDRVPDIFGRSLSILQAYVFSNFRFVQGIATPFTIEHFSNGIKVDEMAFTSVKYNTGVSDDVFLP